MDNSLRKPLTKKQNKLMREYYGRMIRDVGIGMLGGFFTVFFLNNIRGINFLLVLALAFLLVVVGEIMTFWEKWRIKP